MNNKYIAYFSFRKKYLFSPIHLEIINKKNFNYDENLLPYKFIYFLD